MGKIKLYRLHDESVSNLDPVLNFLFGMYWWAEITLDCKFLGFPLKATGYGNTRAAALRRCRRDYARKAQLNGSTRVEYHDL